MGRHRRSAAGRAATGRATGVTRTHGSYPAGPDPRDSYGPGPEGEESDPYARSDAYLFATEEEYALYRGDGYTPSPGSPGAGARRRHRKRGATPMRTGLLGVSAALALGTVAVATGTVPGLENHRLGGGGDSADRVQGARTPAGTPSAQGGTSGGAQDREDSSPASRGAGRPTSPTPSPSPSTSAATATPTPTETPSKKPKTTPGGKPSATPAPSPSRTATKAPERSGGAVTVSAETQAEAEVLKLVNEERAKVGCRAVSANSALSDLAGDFSDAMAEQGFFSHTDPSGATPWDRAAKAGIDNLGGENIARGQADAASVMEAWMNSPGHKANILNCDFTTLGVGVHLGSGGPWWTQDFGY